MVCGFSTCHFVHLYVCLQFLWPSILFGSLYCICTFGFKCLNYIFYLVYVCARARAGFLLTCVILFQAVRKLNEAKKLESTAHYNTDFGKD